MEDPDFLAALKSDPQGTLTKFTGNDFSKVKVNIVEEDGETLTFPVAKLPDDLSAEQLEAIAGGAGFAGVSMVASVAAATYTIGKGEGLW